MKDLAWRCKLNELGGFGSTESRWMGSMLPIRITRGSVAAVLAKPKFSAGEQCGSLIRRILISIKMLFRSKYIRTTSDFEPDSFSETSPANQVVP